MDIVDRIDFLAKKRGWTRSEVFRRIGLNPSAASDWRKGKSSPEKHLIKLAEILGTTELYLRGETNDPKIKPEDPSEPLYLSEMEHVLLASFRSLSPEKREAEVREKLRGETDDERPAASEGQPADPKILELWREFDDLSDEEITAARQYVRFLKSERKERNMKYITGCKPGKGNYKCLKCGEIITLDHNSDTLPPCPKCRATEYRPVEGTIYKITLD